MPAHSIGSGTISFGLVAIPIRLYTAAVSAGVSFHLLHTTCGTRIRQQTYCPVDHAVVERGELVKGYEVAKDHYVPVTEEELQALEGATSTVIDIREFVPLPRVDPIYFERTYYLGPAKGGAKAYRLLAQAMATTGRVALATCVLRGKERLVLLRSAPPGLLLHTLYFVALKGEGKAVPAGGPEVPRIRVIDLMDALRQSLAQRTAPAATPGAPPAPPPQGGLTPARNDDVLHHPRGGKERRAG